MATTFDTARIMDKIDLPSKIEHASGLRPEDRGGPSAIGKDIVLGSATDVRTYPATQYLVIAQKLDMPWPGTDQDVTFGVQELRPNQLGRLEAYHSVGFFSEAECWRYLTGLGEIAATVYDRRGNPSVVVRRCLGIHEGMTSRHPVDLGAILEEMRRANEPEPPEEGWRCPDCGWVNEDEYFDCSGCGFHVKTLAPR